MVPPVTLLKGDPITVVELELDPKNLPDIVCVLWFVTPMNMMSALARLDIA
jgi:hypothetical protein